MATDYRETSGPTLVGLAGITLLMLVLGLVWARQEVPSLSSYADNSVCVDTHVAPGQTLHSADVVVSVFNAGKKPNRAGATMRRLEARGFAPGNTGNSSTAQVERVEVWGDPQSPAAQLVAKQFGSGTRVISGQPRLGDGVVVVIGDKLTQTWGPRVPTIRSTTDAYICGPKAP